ncbi:MAG TPA: amidohydrolase family protein, partial [Chitinophagaceae bacterium]|nr:amidohydrolase family protein [Chitinophagaceae bacterium]
MRKYIIAAIAIVLVSCNANKQAGSQKADLLVYNATIYTVDSSFSVVEAMVIADGKILATGSKEALQKEYEVKDSLDAGGKFIYPGFIDAHAHFTGYGNSLQRVNLTGTTSWEEVIEKTKAFDSTNKDGWLL